MKKHRKETPTDQGVPLNSQALELLRRTHEFYEQEKNYVSIHGQPSIPADKVVERTSKTLGTDAIRRHVYAYYSRKEYPTVSKLLISLKESELFRGGETSLKIVLKNMGFHYKTLDGHKAKSMFQLSIFNR
ncbi:uncharacterized protein LOC126160473 [Schistocerca cancellata]|uniref:uncharacterized protein LOC126160473 n=1 Tax=Schistocerca cancellata TaxID=274614 RepID=UPI0021177808|nr:uncharacterized protein LOC126160473 [Schistocerca cancellata]